jgi:hypothetical protein
MIGVCDTLTEVPNFVRVLDVKVQSLFQANISCQP